MTRKEPRRKRLKLQGFTAVFFGFSCLLYFCSALFLRAYNNSLSAQISDYQEKISTLAAANDSLSVSVSTLTSRDRVESIVQDTDLSYNQDQVIKISESDE